MKTKKHDLSKELKGKEILTQRSLSSKTFQKKNGEFETKYYHKPIHYYDENCQNFVEMNEASHSKMIWEKIPGITIEGVDMALQDKISVDQGGIHFHMQLPERREGTFLKKVNLLFHCDMPPVSEDKKYALRLAKHAPETNAETLIGISPMSIDENEYSFDVTSEYESPEQTVYTLSLAEVSEEGVTTTGVDQTAVMTLSNSAVYSVEETDGNSEDDQTVGESGSIGSVGNYEVDLQSGLLNLKLKGFEWEGNRMPVSFSYYFKSVNATKQYALLKGWRMNLMQTMLLATDGTDTYVYTDENGDESVFALMCCPSGTSCTKYEDDAGNIYDASTKVLALGTDHYTFDAYGRLTNIADQYGNTLQIVYDGTKIDSLKDGVGREFQFTYTNNQMTVSAPDASVITYEYDSYGVLTKVKYPNHQEVVFTYSDHLPSKIEIIDGQNNVTKLTTTFAYSYMSGSNKKISQITNGSNKVTQFTYFGSKQTIVTDIENGDSENLPTIEHNRVFFHENASLNYSYYECDNENKMIVGNESLILPYSDPGMEIGNIKCKNHLRSHVFQNRGGSLDLSATNEGGVRIWNSNLENSSVGGLVFQSPDEAPGYLAAMLVSQSSSNQQMGIWQDIAYSGSSDGNDAPSEVPYVFSAYVRMVHARPNDNSRAYLMVTNTANTRTWVSEAITTASREFVRIVLPFEMESTGSYRVGIYVDGIAQAKVVAPQLEEGRYLSPYNYISAEKNSQVVYADCSSNLANVKVNSLRSVKETFVLSAIVNFEESGSMGNDADVKLGVRIKYLQTASELAEERIPNDEFFVPVYNSGFAFLKFSKQKFRSIESIDVIFDNAGNYSMGQVNDLQLIRCMQERDLSEADFTDGEDIAPEIADTDNGIAIAAVEDSDSTEEVETFTFEEVLDAFGNALTGTTFKNGELGAIYTEQKFAESSTSDVYTDIGNNKTSEIDARGNETKYEYNSATSKPTKVTDRCGHSTSYTYDAAGRTTRVTAPNGGTVNYGYNIYDDLTSITRGDGQAYTMGYDAYRNLTQVKVGGASLVNYSYNPGTNRLKSMEYANGAKQTLTYDRFGNVIGEKWTNGTVTEAHYRYFYNFSNELAKTLDILNRKMYNVNRVGENVTSIEEYDVASINATNYAVSGLTLVGTMHYSFDSEGKQFRKKYVAADGTEQKYVFEFQDEQNVAVQLPTGVVSHSKSDHFGRKVFDELQLGKGFMSRTFTYHEGEITQTHLDNNKRVSKPETTLVKQIEFADGRTIQYEYDAEERITQVIDTINGVETKTEYIYDALGQLLTETVNDVEVNKMTYDFYGNIKTKNGIEYSYSENDVWKDKLISYNDKSITYDAQGNPTNYMGTTLVWEKGRQLKSFGTNTYKYNNDGIRISKTVNGVEHKYVLDGTNIVKETWGSNTLIPLYDLDGTVCGIKYNSTAYYFYKNLQGDVIAITNDAGTVVAKYVYDAWGKCTVTADTSGAGIANINPFRYRSYYYDVETALYYLHSRYYDPAVGRFINADDVNDALKDCGVIGSNIFVYCKNDPVNETDRSGYAIGTTILCWFIGLLIGVFVQFLSDLVIYLFEKILKNTKVTFADKFLSKDTKYEDYIASALSWAFTLISPFQKWKFLSYCSGFLVVAAKHIGKAFLGRFVLSDFIIDAGAAIINAIITHFLGRATQKKIDQLIEGTDVNAAVRYLRECASIRFKFDCFGEKITFALNISPTFLQAICNNIF